LIVEWPVLPAPTIDALEDLLSTALGRRIGIERAERIAPWSVQRCWLRADGDDATAPRSVIVKWLREDPNNWRTDLSQVATEQSALAFLAEIGFRQAPRLIAADHAQGVLILEDARPRTTLADQLRRHPLGSLAEQRRAFARVMGELGAVTAGKAAVYEQRRALFGAFDPSAVRANVLGPEWPRVESMLESGVVSMPVQVRHELAAVVDALTEPGPFLAFSNGDPELNNFLVAGSDGKLIDFEFAGFGHALICARWINVPGPAWITIADPIAGELENTYRGALSGGLAQAQDDHLFGFGLTAVSLAFALERFNRFETLDARPHGDASRVQMLSTFQSAVAVAHRYRSLPDLAGWAERVAAWLRRRWPDANVDLARFPPYTPRG
jgi:hypothetical protein